MIWHFPLPRTHTGVLLGNGHQGLMVWGDEKLHITLGHAGFWDHRGGTEFTSRVTFADVRRMLETHDKAGIETAFASQGCGMGHPQQIGGGRLELGFTRGFRPVRADLDLSNAKLLVTLENPVGESSTLTLRQAMEANISWLQCQEIADVHLRPTWDFVGETLSGMGCEAPQRWGDDFHGGFCQSLPEDDPLAVVWKWEGSRIVLASAVGSDAKDEVTATVAAFDPVAHAQSTDVWWEVYGRDVPRVELPDPILQHIWDYGVYKQAGLTTPGAPAATLQGPWMEEYQVPPWSNDYHFNINLQMIYWPCLSTNRLGHFAPLWDMIAKWLPQLRENADKFFETDGALMLPHAVDDRCSVVGSFWAGTIDHACTAWVAQMAWLHYRYSMDKSVLRDIAWPLLNGAFNGYWAMMEEIEENGKTRLSLPVSVSPEFGGSAMDSCWGRDASFQLAACHMVTKALTRAAPLLGEPVDTRWSEVEKRLPQLTVGHPDRGIALWQGRDLDISHRHHSHLGALYPFCTIDPSAPEYRKIIDRSMANWTRLGAGAWSGWCVPWASALCSRCGLADAAVTWLHWWHDVFTNVGYGTLHDRDFPGVGGLGPAIPNRDEEIMQMDAGLGAVTAVSELLVQCRDEGITVLP